MTTTERAIDSSFLAEILRDAHAYSAGTELRRPTLLAPAAPTWKRRIRSTREHARDAFERSASLLGLSHGHYDPAVAGGRLARLIDMRDGLDATYSRLADETSRRAMRDLLKFRVLGPYHAQLAVRPAEFRDRQAYCDRALRVAADTFTVSDPYFSPLSLYRVPVGNGQTIDLHAHSVDVVSVFLLGQYSYSQGGVHVGVNAGDVVLDVGGCWGDTALHFAHLVGPRGKVFTFEFDPENLAILRANLELNPTLADRIEVVERALWHRSGELLEFAQAGRCTTVDAGATDGLFHRVATLTIDDFVGEAGLDRVDFVKMDVEGAELNVLEGSPTALAEFTPNLAIAAYHKDDDLVRLPEAISEQASQYRFYLGTYSAVEEETVLYASATRPNSST